MFKEFTQVNQITLIQSRIQLVEPASQFLFDRLREAIEYFSGLGKTILEFQPLTEEQKKLDGEFQEKLKEYQKTTPLYVELAQIVNTCSPYSVNPQSLQLISVQLLLDGPTIMVRGRDTMTMNISDFAIQAQE